MAQRSKSPAIFFVDAYTPNEGEMGLCLEYGVLRWSSNKNDRPEVYVHSFLNQQPLLIEFVGLMHQSI